MKQLIFERRYYYVVVIMVIHLLASCSSTPTKENDALLLPAQQALAQAQALANHSAIEPELAQAKETLAQAQNATDETEKQHLAFLAQRQAEIAIAVAQRDAYQQQTQRLTQANKQSQVKKMSHYPKTVQRQRVKGEQLSEKLADWKNNRRGELVIVFSEQVENGSMRFSEKQRDQIETVADFLRQHPHFKVILEGYTDNLGNFQHNQGLSKRWASEMKFNLMKKGIASNRIQVKGFGEMNPIASNYTAAGREKNCRVELVILDEYVPIFAPAAAAYSTPTSSSGIFQYRSFGNR